MSAVQPVDYQTLPLELFTVRDLTDALGVTRAAEIFNTSNRAIYTVRNTNVLSETRVLMLIREIKKDEAIYRQRLIIKRNMQKTRADNRAERADA
jgi:hypothetical protein